MAADMTGLVLMPNGTEQPMTHLAGAGEPTHTTAVLLTVADAAGVVGYVLTVALIASTAMVAVIWLAGRVLLRPRRRRASGGTVPFRPEPKRRDDFTLTS